MKQQSYQRVFLVRLAVIAIVLNTRGAGMQCSISSMTSTTSTGLANQVEEVTAVEVVSQCCTVEEHAGRPASVVT